tara:strand:+ start:3468 stop:3644 length:177 start_codon:yes stop_codon:yes gene_type:complete
MKQTSKINKISQKYFYKLLKDYPDIGSGRKNYKFQYKRILNNLKLIKNFKIKKKQKET